ncbi:restriction endonuclease subunit S, partial [Thiolapillus sp.]
GDAKFIPYMNVFSNTFTDIQDLRSVIITDDESQNAVAKGDVFFTVSSETPEEAGMSSVLLGDVDRCYLNSFCALFRFDDHLSPNLIFLGYLLRSRSVRCHLSRGAQGATRYNISKLVFKELPLVFPLAKEQQKIAHCLSSLDEVIGLESHKLDTLKNLKKGLMQQLFPQEVA